MQLPTHEERAGAQVHRATKDDSPSDRRRYRGALYRQAGKVDDTLTNMSTIVREGLHVTRPTGQNTVARQGPQLGPTHQTGAAVPDLVVGVTGGLAMIAEVIRAGRRARARSRKGHDGNH
jgi:hypothetical protein